jgi:3-methyl-2-oxobutanoate hydroxymethyltransferase
MDPRTSLLGSTGSTATSPAGPSTSGPSAASAGSGGSAGSGAGPVSGPTSVLYGRATRRRTSVRDLARAKESGEKWAMLTAYDALTAAVFDEAGVPVLLVGDSSANVVFGYDTTVPVTVDELLPLARAVVRGTTSAMVVGDLPFGSYQASPAQALATATRFMKEAGVQAVKLEGGERVAQQVDLLVGSGVPVMGHLGLTPQSVNALGGYLVQGRGDAGERLMADALALEEAGAFAVVLEVIPSDLAARITKALTIPTIGIGAGVDCDAQVMVWQDMAGLTGGPAPRFVRRYADLRSSLAAAVTAFSDDVRSGAYPTVEYSYD